MLHAQIQQTPPPPTLKITSVIGFHRSTGRDPHPFTSNRTPSKITSVIDTVMGKHPHIKLLECNQSLTSVSESRLFGSVVRGIGLVPGWPRIDSHSGCGNIFSYALHLLAQYRKNTCMNPFRDPSVKCTCAVPNFTYGPGSLYENI